MSVCGSSRGQESLSIDVVLNNVGVVQRYGEGITNDWNYNEIIHYAIWLSYCLYLNVNIININH